MVVAVLLAITLTGSTSPVSAGVDTSGETPVLTPGGWSGIVTTQRQVESQTLGVTSREIWSAVYVLDPAAPVEGDFQLARFSSRYSSNQPCVDGGTADDHGAGSGWAQFNIINWGDDRYAFAADAHGHRLPVQYEIEYRDCDGNVSVGAVPPPVAAVPDSNWLSGSVTEGATVPVDPTVLRGSASGDSSTPPGLTQTVEHRWRFTTRADSDGDGRPDDEDCQPEVVNDPGEGCQTASDEDGDGVGDDVDACPGTPPGTEVDAFGCEAVPAVVVEYAPQVRLHPDETHFPLSTRDFVAGSRLRWAHDGGCPDSELAAFREVDESRLGSASADPYRAQQHSDLCGPIGRMYEADEVTRPSNEPRADGLAKNEGFFLDLIDGDRFGDLPVDGQVHTPTNYSYEPGEYVTYWFMYGFNPGAPGTGEFIDRHEGEWERITVWLDPDDTPVAVDFFAHECEAPIRRTWSTMTDPNPANGQVVEGTHPVVYSALGSHASFPGLVDIGREGLCPTGIPGIGQGWGDVTEDGGATWSTWRTDLRAVEDEAWFGFGGGWGEADDVSDLVTMGPLAPPHKAASVGDPPPLILGPQPESVEPTDLVEPVNAEAIRRRIWVPGLDDGFIPQGLTVIPPGVFEGERVLISGYLKSPKRCRVYAVDPVTGNAEPVVYELPSTVRCKHAGGIDYQGVTTSGTHLAYLADTEQLIRLDLNRAFSANPTTRSLAIRKRWPLDPNTSNPPSTDRKPFSGSFVAVGQGGPCPHPLGCVWVGTYSESGTSWLRRFNIGYLDNKPSMQPLAVRQATQRLSLPRRAQGADFDGGGNVWASASRALLPGCLHRMSGPRSSYQFVQGSEELRWSAGGTIWTVSEVGSAPYRGALFAEYPLILEVDPSALTPTTGTCDPG